MCGMLEFVLATIDPAGYEKWRKEALATKDHNEKLSQRIEQNTSPSDEA